MIHLNELGAASWGFRELPMKERLTVCKRLGIKYLEVGIANALTDIPLDVEEQELDKLKQLYQEFGINHELAATGNDFTLTDPEELQKQIEKVMKVIDICSKWKVKYLRIFAGFSPVEEVTGSRWRNMIHAINSAADYAREKKVTLAIETHGGVNSYEDGVVHFPSVSTQPESLEKMMREIPSDVKFVFDVANLYAVGNLHPEEIYKAISERIAYFHMKDFTKQSGGHYLPAACGDSDMDWETFIGGIADDTGPMLIEYENTEDLEKGILRSMQFLKRLLKADGL